MDHAYLISVSTLENPNTPNALILNNETNKIGRKAQLHIDTSKGKEISKVHAIIQRSIDKTKTIWRIEDKKSLNGTFINGEKISSSILKENDEIVFGGGPNFVLGDRLCNTEKAECRYIFVLSDPKVNFTKEALSAYENISNRASSPICTPLEKNSFNNSQPLFHIQNAALPFLNLNSFNTPNNFNNFNNFTNMNNFNNMNNISNLNNISNINSSNGNNLNAIDNSLSSFSNNPLTRSDPNFPISISFEISKDECPICYEFIKDPVSLSCGHTFCMHCLSTWQKQCQGLFTPEVCPICRHDFQSQNVIRSPLLFKDNELIVYNCDRFMYQLNITSLKDLEAVSLSKHWSDKERQLFWDCFQLLENSRKKKLLFLYLVSGTYQQVQEMNEEELSNVLENLGGKVILRHDENDIIYLKGEALKLVGTIFHNVQAPDLSIYHHH